MSYRCVCLFVTVIPFLAGCHLFSSKPALQVLPASQAPYFGLDPLPKIRGVSFQKSASVEVLDSRPSEEKAYYPGLNEPRHWRDAVTMLPIEAFDPSVADHLAAKMQAVLPPEIFVRIEITSFHVVFDERQLQFGDQEMRRDALENERYEEDERREREKERREALEAERAMFENEDEDTSFADVLFSGMLEALAIAGREVGRSAQNLVSYSDLPQQTPAFVTEECREGLNCHIDLLVTVSGPSSQVQEFSVAVRQHRSRDLNMSLQPQVALLVDTTLQEVREKIVEKLGLQR